MVNMLRSLGLAVIAALVRSVVGDGAITATGTNFSLTADAMSYLFHVDHTTGDLTSDHFGGLVDDFTPPAYVSSSGWADGFNLVRREFPDSGRSDFRLPAIHILHSDGDTVSAFYYQSHEIVPGKPKLPGLPATWGGDSDVTTLQVKLYDNFSDVAAMLSYSVFPKYNAIARSFQITNQGKNVISIERAASFSVDLPNLDLNLIDLQGDWAHERNRDIRPIRYGETTFRSTEGYSSHLFNPFMMLATPTTTESYGEAWGFNLVYTGSFAATAERFSNGFIRILLGLNPLHASWPLQPGETFTSPEAVAVYSSEGLGGMSRSFHDLYRNHLSRSNYTFETRPVLLNSWEGLGFDYNQSSMVKLAGETAGLGISLFVNDDGWFGNGKYARVADDAGLGDWQPNRQRFPNGLGPYVDEVNNFTVKGTGDDLKFGIWVEPEMVNPNSSLYQEHPDWCMHAGNHIRTLTRNQLVLNVGLTEVQDFIIDTISRVVNSANISYIKWQVALDMSHVCNMRHKLIITIAGVGITTGGSTRCKSTEGPTPAADHAYMLGLYRIIDNLTTTFPSVLWEGCASGGGRFDPGLYYYWSQHWTSDNTDASARLNIQVGTSMAYPPSAMACHVSAVPNGVTQRNISITYRANVALMCGSFGFELNPVDLMPDERAAIPEILKTWEQVNPVVLSGSFYRLVKPEDSNWPAVQFVSKDESSAILFAFQQMATLKPAAPPVRLQGLDPTARYSNTLDNSTYSGSTYMNGGLNFYWESADYQSQLIWLYKQ